MVRGWGLAGGGAAVGRCGMGAQGGGGWGHTVLTVTRSVLTFSDSSRKSGHRFQQRTSLCAFCR